MVPKIVATENQVMINARAAIDLDRQFSGRNGDALIGVNQRGACQLSTRCRSTCRVAGWVIRRGVIGVRTAAAGAQTINVIDLSSCWLESLPVLKRPGRYSIYTRFINCRVLILNSRTHGLLNKR